jgi:hypothetical protein
MNKLVTSLYYETLKEIFNVLPLLTNLGLSAALLFLMVQINRLIGKEVFQRLYFQDEIHMPTTNHLLWNDTFFDNSIKEKIRLKINEKFGLVLMTQEEEDIDQSKSRKQIVTAVSQIRNSLRGNQLLLQHNIEYGFFRNLLGGSLIATIFSITIFVYGIAKHENPLMLAGIGLTVIYSLPIILSKPIIRRFGNYYSKILYEQFLSI